MARATRQDVRILAAIVALALVLRLVGLNSPLWYDEILAVDTHLRLPWGQLLSEYSMNHHYLYDVFAKISMDTFGEVPWAIRLPAMILGLCSIVAVWVLAKDVADTRIAHVTALLLAVSYHHIWFSQNARGYTGLAFFGTAAIVLFMRGIHRPRVSVWLWFAAAFAASVFTHLTGAFLFAALGMVWVAVAVPEIIRTGWSSPLVRLPFMGFMIGGLVTILLYLPIIPGIFSSVAEVSDTSAIDVMQEYQSPIWTMTEAVRTGIGRAGMIAAAVSTMVVILVALGSASIWRRHRMLPIITLTHIVLTLIVLLALNMRIWPRFFFIDIGLILLLIVLGVRSFCIIASGLAGRISLAPHVFNAACVAMVLVSVPLALRNYSAPKQDLDGAYAMVQDEGAAAGRVYAVGPAGEVFESHYKAGWGSITGDDGYVRALAEPGPVTLVVVFPQRVFRRIPRLANDIGDVLRVARRFPGTLGDGAVVVLQRK